MLTGSVVVSGGYLLLPKDAPSYDTARRAAMEFLAIQRRGVLKHLSRVSFVHGAPVDRLKADDDPERN